MFGYPSFSKYTIFILKYRYLDLYEAIEEGSTDALDNTDLLETDIPLEVPLPEVPHLPRESHEAVKEWVLAVSMDQKVEQILPVYERMAYEASLTNYCKYWNYLSALYYYRLIFELQKLFLILPQKIRFWSVLCNVRT